MDKVYFLLKLNRVIKSARIKSLGIFFLHVFKRRYIGIFLDPVLACNLRCRMCYFSDEAKRKELKGRFSDEELLLVANAFFHRALKLQIGCGAEPSLYKHNVEIIRLAKKTHIPYISLTTNGILFSEEDLRQLVEAGLNEITLSLHGVKKETYEYFMSGASFDKFCEVLQALNDIKKEYLHLKIRINYTVNKDNLEDLRDFFNVFGTHHFDIIQVRPIQEIGNSDYHNFSWSDIYERYDEIISSFKNKCIEKNITCLIPNKHDLVKSSNEESSVSEQTYCYVSPRGIWENDFDIQKDTFETYSKRKHLAWVYFKKVFERKSKKTTKRSLNYEVI